MPFVFSLLVLAATVVAVVDIVTRDEGQIRHMPKFLWLLLVILLPLLGAILWFTIGREYPARPVRSRPVAASPSHMGAPMRDRRSTEEQLADLELEIEEERLRAELRRRQAGGSQPSDG